MPCCDNTDAPSLAPTDSPSVLPLEPSPDVEGSVRLRLRFADLDFDRHATEVRAHAAATLAGVLDTPRANVVLRGVSAGSVIVEVSLLDPGPLTEAAVRQRLAAGTFKFGAVTADPPEVLHFSLRKTAQNNAQNSVPPATAKKNVQSQEKSEDASMSGGTVAVVIIGGLVVVSGAIFWTSCRKKRQHATSF